MDFLNRIDEFDPAQARPRSATTCSNGSSNSRRTLTWISDPLAGRLPKRFQPLVSSDQLADLGLEAYDVQMLQEATWLRDVANSVVRQQQMPPDLRRLIDSTRPVVDADRQNDLTHALRLFDWTVRNLQLEQIQQDGQQRFGSDLILQCWESLLMGRGTLEEKSRVFMLLARQLGVTVVMLGMDTADAAEHHASLAARGAARRRTLTCWTCGWDWPILGPDGKAVATLEQVLEQPELLQRMAGIRGRPYPVRAAGSEGVGGAGGCHAGLSVAADENPGIGAAG